jgi:hypothetical protein
MNLSTIRSLLQNHPIEGAHLQAQGNTVKNLTAFKKAIAGLETVLPLQPVIAELKQSPLYSTTQDTLGLTNSNLADDLAQSANGVLFGSMTLKRALEAMLPEPNPNTVFVTMPADHSLRAVTEVMEKLDTALGPLVLDGEINGQLEIISWEIGSLILHLCLGSIPAVYALGRLLKSAAAAYHQMQMGRLVGQQVQQLKIKNETLQDVQSAQATLLKDLIDREALAADKEIFKEDNGERLGRVTFAIKTLAELLDQGARIAPTLEMPEEQKSSFPNPDLLEAPPIKQLERGADNGDEG